MYSVSKVQCFEQCPLKFKLTYIDKVEIERSEALKKGSSVHSVFENLGKPANGQETSEAVSVVEKFLKSPTGLKYLPTILKAKKEVRVGLKKADDLKKAEAGLEPCAYSKKALFGGIIDLLFENHILDYKTGKAKTYEEQDWTQLTWYAIWLFLTTDYNEVTISYIYVEHDQVNEKTLYRKDLKAMITSMLSRMVAIKKFEDNPSDEHKSSWKCSFCGCRKHCPFFVDNVIENIKAF